jgi:uncharacterized membrane protein YgdD (TMEM256/DUF423 family)
MQLQAGNCWIFIGAVSGFLSVALGAFGAHALASSLSEKALGIYQTASHYQMVHALALVAIGVLLRQDPALASSWPSSLAGWGFALGTLFFSGSLYALAVTDIKILGAITPLGGLSFMVGWISLAVLAWRS